MSVSTIITPYTLFRGAEKVLVGSEDTIRLYLRQCLDKWEDFHITPEFKARWDEVFTTLPSTRDFRLKREYMGGEKKRLRVKAYYSWKVEMDAEDWFIQWRDGANLTHKFDVVAFLYGECVEDKSDG